MASSHTEVTDVLNTENATATISTSGLGLFCFTEQGGFEGGFVRLSSHEYRIDIRQMGADGVVGPALRIVNLNGDVDIKVINPVSAVSKRFEKGDFNRTADGNDPQDFRWILDIEGPEMNAAAATPNTKMVREGGPRRLARLNINSGTFYTTLLTQEPFARVRVDDPQSPPTLFGRIAHEVGVDLECTDDEKSGIMITFNGSDGTVSQLFLPALEGVKYNILFSNDCPEQIPSPETAASDFHFFYDILKDPNGKEFDFAKVVPPNDPTATGGPLDDTGDTFRGVLGQVCDQIYMSETSSLSQFS